GNGGSVSASVTVTVTPVNDPPVAVDDSASTPEDVPVTIAPLANDSDLDGDPLIITDATTTNGTVVIVGGTNLLFSPTTNFNGTTTIPYTISDGNGGSASATVTVTVTPVNDAPVAVNDSFTTAEATSLNIAAAGVLANDSDVDGDALRAVLVSGPTHGSLTLNANGSFSYVPAANYNGSDSFTYKANDGLADSSIATVTLTITAVNDAPVAVNDSYTTAEDATLNVAAPGVLANDSDVDGDALNAILVSQPTHTSLTLNTNDRF